ncbi:MAG: hypothetical protein IK137_03820 [Bacilli bacterium]|nr:hypothetical protein [Bacilli bacterium]
MSIDSDKFIYMSSSEMIEYLDKKRRCADAQRKENKELGSALESIKPRVPKISEEIQISDKKEDIEDSFEKEFEYYFGEFKKLKEYTKESIEEVLPSLNDYNYERIVMRIIAEISRDIKGYREILFTFGPTMNKEELEEYRNEIVYNNAIRLILKDILFTKEKEKIVETKNKLIFVPVASTGKIRIFDELKDIPSEEYDGFIDLLESIKDGTFKGFKVFNNNETLNGLLEVRRHLVRVVYQRLSKDCYAIISIFMKKTQNDNGYKKPIQIKYAEYKTIEKELKKSVNDPSFLEKHEKYEEEVFKILGSDKNNGKGVK